MTLEFFIFHVITYIHYTSHPYSLVELLFSQNGCPLHEMCLYYGYDVLFYRKKTIMPTWYSFCTLCEVINKFDSILTFRKMIDFIYLYK